MLPDETDHDSRVIVLINALSSTLMNIDAEYESEVARVHSTASPELRTVILGTVRRRHLQRREPYVRHLVELRQSINARR